MIHVLFGKTEGALYYPPNDFSKLRKASWLKDQLIIDMIKDIDGVTVLGTSELVHPHWGELTIDELSGGVKTLMLLYKLSDHYTFDITACGDNCAEWVLKIARARAEDLYVVLRYEMDLWKFGESIHILNNDTLVAGDTGESFVEAGIEFIRHDCYNVWDHKTKTFTTRPNRAETE